MSGISPEEKLLRLIRQNKKTVPQAPGGKSVILPAGFFLKILAWLNAWSFLCLILVLAFFYWIYAFFIDAALTERMTAVVAQKTAKQEAPKVEPATQEKPLDYYMQGLRNAPVFKEGAQESAVLDGGGGMDPELVKDLNLIGILSGDNSEAMIEDKKMQKTHQVQVGQFVGEFKVEKITSNKVTLTHKGSHYDLTL